MEATIFFENCVGFEETGFATFIRILRAIFRLARGNPVFFMHGTHAGIAPKWIGKERERESPVSGVDA